MALVIKLAKNPQFYKNLITLVVAVMVTIVLMAGLGRNNETLFAALLAFALMVPVNGSAAVALYRQLQDGERIHCSHYC